MAQTIQSKRLRAALKELGIKDRGGKVPSCRAERFARNIKGEKRFHELGLARAVVWRDYNASEVIEQLKLRSDVKVYLETERCIYVES